MKIAILPLALLLIMFAAPADARDPLASYLTSIARKCEKAYYPPGDLYGTACSVRFTIDKKGNPLNLEMVEIPNYTGTDREDAFAIGQLRDAIVHASRFRAIPRKLGSRMTVDVKFDTTVTHRIIVTATTASNGGLVSSSYSN
jgi:hypothetical protein